MAAPATASVSPTIAPELLPSGRWTIDPDHSGVGFVVHHLGITRLRGRFTDVTGLLVMEDGRLSGTATVSANSFDTGNEARDRHVKGPDFLGAEMHPRIVFTVAGVRPDGDDAVVDGTLALHGETRPVELHAVSGGTAKDPYGHDRIGLSLTTSILRSDYGITFDRDGALVSDAVAIEIDLSLVRQPAYLRDVARRHEASTP